MRNILFIILLSFISLAFAQFPNCAKLGLHTLEWKVANQRVQFQAKISQGQRGWVSLGVGTDSSLSDGMNNITLVMGFKNGTNFYSNEYYYSSINKFGRPTLYSSQDTQMTANALAVNGADGLTLNFTRPLTSNVLNYYPILSGKKVKMIIAYNSDTLPTSASVWLRHTKYDVKDIDLTAAYGIAECNSAPTQQLVLLSVIAIFLTYFL
jgi:hypothetical protein